VGLPIVDGPVYGTGFLSRFVVFTDLACEPSTRLLEKQACVTERPPQWAMTFSPPRGSFFFNTKVMQNMVPAATVSNQNVSM
jgi:hypothetical protein